METKSENAAGPSALASGSVVLTVGRTYRGKKPKGCGFPPLTDDRIIVHIGLSTVQYDSPSVRNGRRYPIISREKFEKWVARDVSDELPKGEWADYPPNTTVSRGGA